ncbi:hypothetical protein Tco_1140109, partial [Tanacetum coccineum]
LKKKYDDLLVKLDDTGFKASTYKRGLSILEGQVVKYKEHEVLFSEEIALLKRSVGHKEYQMGLLRTELEKVKEENKGFEFKITKFEKSAKDLDQLLANQITDKSKKGFGYNVVPSPHPLILNRPTPLDLSYSGLEEFKEPEVNGYGPRDSSLKSTTGCDKESDNSKENTNDSLKQQQKTDSKTSSVKSPLKVDKDWKEKFFCPANHVREEEPKKARENTDAPIIDEWVSDDEDEVETTIVVKKKTVIPTAAKIEKPVRKPVRYAEMYRSQRPRGNQRNWNGQKSNQLGSDFVMHNKACYICGSFDHLQITHPNPRRNIIPQAVLMRSGIKAVNTAKPKAAHNAVKRNSFNTVKASACWVWMPKNRVIDHVSKYNNASVTLKRLDYIDAQGRFKSVMAWMDAQTQGRQECSKEKEESREECNKSRKTKKMKPKKARENTDAPIIDEWVSDDEDEVETTIVVKKKTVIPTAAKIEKPVRKPVSMADSFVTPAVYLKNNRHDNDKIKKKTIIPQDVLMRFLEIKQLNTAKPKAAHNAVKRNSFNTVKASACWVWMPKNRVIDHVSKYNNASVTLKD